MSSKMETAAFKSHLTSENDVALDASSWDKRLASDLIAEIEAHLGDKVSTLPEMRRILAVKGYRSLRGRIEADIQCLHGLDALRTMAYSMRLFALERPGLSAATFRTPTTDSPEWRHAVGELSETVLGVFAGAGLEGERAQQAFRILRSFVRGFVLNEIAATFLDPLDYQTSYELGIEVLIAGFTAMEF